MAQEAHRVIAMIIGEDEDDAVRFAAGEAFGHHFPGHGDDRVKRHWVDQGET